MRNVELAPGELIAALNWLDQNNLHEISIETPWSKEQFVSIELEEPIANANLSINSTKSDFSETAHKENIDQTTIESAFFASGIVKPIGWTDLMIEIDEIRSRNLLQGDRPRRIVFDTVALNRRYYSVLERQLSSLIGIREPVGWGVSYLTTTGILKELAKYDWKYRQEQLVKLSQEFPVDWFDWKGFTNQLMSRDRVFRLGDVEGKKMCNSGRCVRASSRVGDDEIINALEKHARYNREEILAVSEDSDFVSKCKSYEINALRLDRGRLPSGIIKARWIEVCELQYVLAVILGAFRTIWNDGWFLLEGIWRGKKEESWNQERVRLSSENKELIKWLIDFKAIAE
ncbi:MAG: hypothetical protein ACXACG_08775 [Candidatus Thorarchaeota archaeon]|jgi:hypothetical protein